MVLRGQVGGADAARGDFGLGEAFGAVGRNAPVGKARLRRRAAPCRSARRESPVHASRSSRASASRSGSARPSCGAGCARAFALFGEQPVGWRIGQESRPRSACGAASRTDICRIAGPDRPRWVNSAASRKRPCLQRTDNIGGNARQFAEQRVVAAQREAAPAPGAAGRLEAELAGEIIGKAGRAHLGDRWPAGGEHQRGRFDRCGPTGDAEPPVACSTSVAGWPSAGSRRRARTRSTSMSTICRAEPSQNSCPSVFSCQAMPWRSTSARKSCGVNSGPAPTWRNAGWRKDSGRRGVDVGEVAAPAAGNQDLLARRIGMIDQQHALAARARGQRAHQPRRARAKDDGVKVAHAPSDAGVPPPPPP
jgi:hypothetical protein